MRMQGCAGQVDLLGALDAWVDVGKAPDSLMQVSQQEEAPFKTIASRRCAAIRSAAL